MPEHKKAIATKSKLYEWVRERARMFDRVFVGALAPQSVLAA